MKKVIFLLIFLFVTLTIFADLGNMGNFDAFSESMVGEWNFDNQDDLLDATVGRDLILVGSHEYVKGFSTSDGAAKIGTGSYYIAYHNIDANGDFLLPDKVNKYTLVFDVKIPSLYKFYSLLQTDPNNHGNLDLGIKPWGCIFIPGFGYSRIIINPNEWYRIVVSVNLGKHLDVYLDGEHLWKKGAMSVDGLMALSPRDMDNRVLFFADDNGNDNELTVSNIVIYNRDLSPDEIKLLGGFNHRIEKYHAYLQTPTDNSIYISWPYNSSYLTSVEYRPYGSSSWFQVRGDSNLIGDNTIWHTVKLTNLRPSTLYYYRYKSGNFTSKINFFFTQPNVNSTSGHIRFAVLGDTRTGKREFKRNIIAIKKRIQKEYGNVAENLNFIMNLGDVVGNGNSQDGYSREYFEPISEISGIVSCMITIGDHEHLAEYFYDYVHYQDFQGGDDEKYYSFRIASILFISLNSVVAGEEQISWLQNQLEQAENNDNIKRIFVFFHRPPLNEIWTHGNNAWAREYVMPLLKTYDDKVAIAFSGHSHDYERGIWKTSNVRTIVSGGGGAELARWRLWPEQQDYNFIHRSFDYYNYMIVDVNLANGDYVAKTYTFGNSDKPLNDILLDEFYFYTSKQPPHTPEALYDYSYEGYTKFVASQYIGDFPVMCYQFQIAEINNSWSAAIVDTVLMWEDIYYDTGYPDFEPIDRNENLELNKLTIADSVLEGISEFKWRVRYRDQNLSWSSWSIPYNTKEIEKIQKNIKIYPNPFNPDTKITFGLKNREHIKIDIYNLKGEKIKTLLNNYFNGGNHSIVWNGTNEKGKKVSSGVYFIKMQTSNKDTTVKKCILLK